MNQNRIASQPVQVNSVQAKEPALKTGQIVEGKAVKLYPNQKALIQIGSRQMVAQLETALSVGERYHFQVRTEEGTVYLKVLGEQSAKNPDQNIATLLSRLGLQQGKTELAFTKSLLDAHIPVQKEQLRQAFSLLKEASSKPEAAQLLRTMIANRIPLTKDVFQALFTKETKGLNEVMKQALSQFVKAAGGNMPVLETSTASHQPKGSGMETLLSRLQSRLAGGEMVNSQPGNGSGKVATTPNGGTAGDMARQNSVQEKALQSAINTLGKMSERPQFLASLAMKQLAPVLSENKAVFLAFKEAGLIRTGTTFEMWKNEWNTFIEKNASSFKEPVTNQNQPAMNAVKQTSAQQTQSASLSKNIANQPSGQQGMTGASTSAGQIIRQGDAVNAQSVPIVKQAEGNQTGLSMKTAAQNLNQPAGNYSRAEVHQSESTVRLALPFNLTETEASETLGKWIGMKEAQQGAADRILAKYGEVLRNVQTASAPMSAREFTSMTRQIEQELLPLLSDKDATALKVEMRNNPEILMKLVTRLGDLSAFKAEKPMLEALQMRLHNGSLFTMPQPKDQMLGAIRQMLDDSGMLHEQNIVQGDSAKAAQDLKSQLITLDRGNPGPVQEAGRQMLNFINGMQLQSVTQTDHFIQASLMLPGGALGLSNDARLDFEGKRNENGEINPEFCRILFYLELEHIDETVIDMNVHKGNISVTVYNDHNLTPDVAKSLVPLLETGLGGMDYKLASLTVKPRSEKVQTEGKAGIGTEAKPIKGTGKVDYRV